MAEEHVIAGAGRFAAEQPDEVAVERQLRHIVAGVVVVPRRWGAGAGAVGHLGLQGIVGTGTYRGDRAAQGRKYRRQVGIVAQIDIDAVVGAQRRAIAMIPGVELPFAQAVPVVLQRDLEATVSQGKDEGQRVNVGVERCASRTHRPRQQQRSCGRAAKQQEVATGEGEVGSHGSAPFRGIHRNSGQARWPS